jgi:hypothetical protein
MTDRVTNNVNSTQESLHATVAGSVLRVGPSMLCHPISADIFDAKQTRGARMRRFATLLSDLVAVNVFEVHAGWP